MKTGRECPDVCGRAPSASKNITPYKVKEMTFMDPPLTLFTYDLADGPSALTVLAPILLALAALSVVSMLMLRWIRASRDEEVEMAWKRVRKRREREGLAGIVGDR